jgi:hypothetical protein
MAFISDFCQEKGMPSMKNNKCKQKDGIPGAVQFYNKKKVKFLIILNINVI